jgi:hypothetical protein
VRKPWDPKTKKWQKALKLSAIIIAKRATTKKRQVPECGARSDASSLWSNKGSVLETNTRMSIDRNNFFRNNFNMERKCLT